MDAINCRKAIEKITNNGFPVHHIRLSNCTLVTLIAGPLICLLTLYLLLFSECTYLVRNGCDSELLDTSDEFFEHLPQDKAEMTENKTNDNPDIVRVDIDDELGLKGFDEDEVIKLFGHDGSAEKDYVMNQDVDTLDTKMDSNAEMTSSVVVGVKITRVILPVEDSSINDDRVNEDTEFFGELLSFVANLFKIFVTFIIEESTEKNVGVIEGDDIPKNISSHYKVISSLSDDRYKDEEGNVTDVEWIGPQKVDLDVKKKSSNVDLTLEDSTVELSRKRNGSNEQAQKSTDDKDFNTDFSKISDVQELLTNEIKHSSNDYDHVPKEDTLKYVNYERRSFNIVNTFICPNDGEDVNLLIGILTRVKNRDQRKSIRDTWGSVARTMDGVKYVFIVGVGLTDDIDIKMKQESDLYQDVIQTDLMDTVANKETNSVLFLKWVDENCPKAKYVAKIEVNIFLNIPQIYEFIVTNEVDTDSMYGFLYTDETPVRDSTNISYYTPKELYAGEVYPDYLGRDAYLIPGKHIKNLYDEAKKSFLQFPQENILITGILAERLKINREDVSEFFVSYFLLMNDPLLSNPCSYIPYCVIRDLTTEYMYKLWDDVLKPNGFNCFNFFQSYKKVFPDGGLTTAKNNNKLIYPTLMEDKPKK